MWSSFFWPKVPQGFKFNFSELLSVEDSKVDDNTNLLGTMKNIWHLKCYVYLNKYVWYIIQKVIRQIIKATYAALTIEGSVTEFNSSS